MTSNDRFEVLGTLVDAVTPQTAIARVEQLVASDGSGYLVFCTVSTVLSARKLPMVHRALQEAALVTPDGMPLVWLGKRSGVGTISRVYGPDFMLDLMQATGSNLRHYFFGGAEEVAEEMATRLKDRFPNLVIAGWHSPPRDLDPAKPNQQDIDRINAAGPDIVWVGLGHPKQELWMYFNLDHLEVPVLAGVGAAFDFHSGRKKEAPEWVKKSGLQWLHRLVREPRRLWRRYLVGNSMFVWLLIREKLGRRRRPAGEERR